MLSPQCNTKCDRLNAPIVHLDYYFPTWFLHRKLHFELRHRRNLGPEQLLRVTRVVSGTSDIFRWALQGNAEGVKSVLRDGRGSPFDTEGSQTALHVSSIEYQTKSEENEF